MNHVVFDLARSHAIAKTAFFKIIGRHAHVFHAPGNHHIRIPDLDSLGRQHDRL